MTRAIKAIARPWPLTVLGWLVRGRPVPSMRVAGAAQALTGAALVARPHDVARAVAGGGAVPAPVIVRLLGARMAVQGAVEAGIARRGIVWFGVFADTAHGTSMIALARLQPEYRRPAVTSAAVALGSAALGTMFALRAPAERA